MKQIPKKDISKTDNKNPPDPILQYALDVVEGREIAGPHVRAACKRHISDFNTRHEKDLFWSLKQALRVCNFYPKILKLAGGASEGQPFKLEPAQLFIIGSLFGWHLPDKKTRRFNCAYIEMGKGSGKSPLAGGLGLYMMTSDGEPRAEVYSAATDKDQAKILFRDAVAMVDLSPELSDRIVKSGGKNGDVTRVYNLAYIQGASFFRPISSEAKGRGRSGFRPYCMLLDEVHEHPTDAMVEFTRKNLKGRPNSLAFMITNSGVRDPGSVCMRYHDYAIEVARGSIQDDTFFSYVCALDEGDEWTDPKVWKKSNPLLGVTIPHSYLHNEVEQSKGMPSRQSLTRRLNFCEWVDASSPLFDMTKWEACRKHAAYSGTPVGALDLSNKNHLSALVLLFPTGAVLPIFWTPEIGLREREERDRAPYRQWVRDGLLRTVPGAIIDFSWIANEMGKLRQQYGLDQVAFDPWNIDRMIKALNDENIQIKMIHHGQGFRDMSPSLSAFEDRVLAGELAHGGHEVLDWCVRNAAVETDPAGNRKFIRGTNDSKLIDGAVALGMACGLMTTKAPAPKFQLMIL